MKRNFKFTLFFFILVFSMAIMAACNNSSTSGDADNQKGTKAGKEKDKVTIRWAHQWGEEHFQDTYGKYLEEEFPNVTIEIQKAGTDFTETLEQVIAAKKSPDVVTMGLLTHAGFLKDLGLAYNMDELIEKEGFELDRLEPSIVQYARNKDPNREGGLYIIPNSRPTYSLHYNKDIFDTLGVNYPSDDLTWEEVTELAKELTREMNGVQYRGLDLDVPYDAYTQFGQNSVDPDTNEVLITESEAYRRYLEMVGAVTSIPGNYPAEEPGSLLHNWGELFGEGNVAMAPAATHHGWLENDNIDIATYPVWEGYEGINPAPNAGGFAITEPSNHKELVLEMIEFLLSDEVQIEKSKQGGASVLKDPKIHEVYGEDKPEFEGKNIPSLFKNEYSTGPDKTPKYGDGVYWEAPIKFVNSGKDINEFLRILQEEAEANVKSQMESE